MNGKCDIHSDPIIGYNIETIDKVRPICSRCIPLLHKGYFGEQRYLTFKDAEELIDQLRIGGLLKYKEEIMEEVNSSINRLITQLQNLREQISSVLDLLIQTDPLQEKINMDNYTHVANLLFENCQYSNNLQKYQIKQTNQLYSQINQIVKQTKSSIHNFKEQINTQFEQLQQREVELRRLLKKDNQNQNVKELFKLVGHKGKITCLAYYQKTKLLFSAGHETIKIIVWDTRKKYIEQILSGHHDQIKNLQVYDDKLISYGLDNKIILWDYNVNYKIWEIKELIQQNYCIIITKLMKNKIVSICNDNVLRIWDGLKCEKELKNKSELTSLDCNNDYVAVGQIDGIIRIRKELNYVKLNAHYDCVKVLKFKQNELISASWDKTIKIWMELKNGDYSCIQTKYEHQNFISFINIIGNSLVTCDEGRIIIFWDYKKKWEINNSIGRYPLVNCQDTFSQFLFLGFEDGNIQILQIN